MKVKIITDSASDMMDMQNDVVRCIPITVRFGQDEYKDGENLTHAQFYEKLSNSKEIPQTSQITPFEFEQAYEENLKDADELVVIPIGAQLSGTCQNAMMAAQDYENVYVVDPENASLGQKILVLRAEELAREGKSAAEIADILNKEKKRVRLLAVLDTLEYLKKGGRISGAAAAAGTLMNLKPMITLEDGKVVNLGKARGTKKGHHLLRDTVLEKGGIDFSRPYVVGYSGTDTALVNQFLENASELWDPNAPLPEPQSIGSTIGIHAGPGAVGVAFFEPEEKA